MFRKLVCKVFSKWQKNKIKSCQSGASFQQLFSELGTSHTPVHPPPSKHGKTSRTPTKENSVRFSSFGFLARLHAQARSAAGHHTGDETRRSEFHTWKCRFRSTYSRRWVSSSCCFCLYRQFAGKSFMLRTFATSASEFGSPPHHPLRVMRAI